MRYLSVCSGIEAASVAWHQLGWTPVAFSEIDAFPRAVLAHHYPDVPNWGDLTKYKDWPDACVCDSRREQPGTAASRWRLAAGRDDVHAQHEGQAHGSHRSARENACGVCGGTVIDLLVGGTPCQAFSVAGLRKGLDDPRGNLTLTYLAVADRYRPEWVVWENVPGVLSQDNGRAFGAFLGGLGQLGYGFAYRVLDAQYFGLAQRRKRVFVVGHLGDWRRAAAVLFDEASLRGDSAPRREAREVAPTVPARRSAVGGLGTDFDCDGGLIAADVAPTLNAHFGSKQGLENQHIDGGAGLFIAHALRADGFDASEDGTGRGTPLAPTLKGAEQSNFAAVAFSENQRGDVYENAVTQALNQQGGKPGQGYPAIRQHMAVRRLTPRECERLQGFPDDYTLIPYRGKLAADGPRYKALGNSMAVPVMAWLGAHIASIQTLGDHA